MPITREIQTLDATRTKLQQLYIVIDFKNLLRIFVIILDGSCRTAAWHVIRSAKIS